MSELDTIFFLVTALIVTSFDVYSTWRCMVSATRLFREPWRREAGVFRYALRRFGVRRPTFALGFVGEFVAFTAIMLLFEGLSVPEEPFGWLAAGMVWGTGISVVRNNLYVAKRYNALIEGKPDPSAPDLSIEHHPPS